MTDFRDPEHELLHQLESDPYFSDWHEANRLFTRADVDRAIAQVLASQRGEPPVPPDAHDRAMRRLALFQVVAPYLADRPRTWIELLGSLRREDLTRVEELLDKLSLGELLEEP